MMNILLFMSLCLLAAVAAAPVSSADSSIYIVKYYNVNDGSGSYRYGFELSDGTVREETGELVNRGLENEHISVHGLYAYIGQDNVKYRFTYKSDEDGFDPDIEQGPGGGIPPAVVASMFG